MNNSFLIKISSITFFKRTYDMYLQTLTTLIFHVKIDFYLSNYEILLIYFTYQNTKFFWFIWFYLSKYKIYLILPVKIQNSFDLFDFTFQNTKFIWFIWFYLSKHKIYLIYLILPFNTHNSFDLLDFTCLED